MSIYINSYRQSRSLRSDIIKFLLLYYYMLDGLLDFKDQVCELLTTMDTCQVQLSIVSCFVNILYYLF